MTKKEKAILYFIKNLQMRIKICKALLKFLRILSNTMFVDR